MKKNIKKLGKTCLSILMATTIVMFPLGNVQLIEASDLKNTVFINEVESIDENKGNNWGELIDVKSDKAVTEDQAGPNLVINEVNSAPDDWIELMNVGTEELDIYDFEIRDNSDDHRWRFSAGTKLQAGELILIEANTIGEIYNDQLGTYVAGEFSEAIGIGSGDSIRLYDTNQELVDEISWLEHASYDGNQSLASLGRYPDGTGSFVLMKETPGNSNDWYKPSVVINEIESNGDETDWVEIYNIGTTAVDLSGWYILDDDKVGHAFDVTPVENGAILYPGEYYVFDQMKQFTFGLGKKDEVTVFNKDGIEIDYFQWTDHAEGVLARIPDGIGEFIDFNQSTKGKANITVNPVVLNEIQSNDPEGRVDWIELANPTKESLDVSGIVIKDADDTHKYVIPEGTIISPNGFIVLTEEEFGFGLDNNDEVCLYEDNRLLTSAKWEEHQNPTLGLYPDVKGKEYHITKKATPGAINIFSDIPEVIEWEGKKEVIIYDTEQMFLEDSSGLDFFNGQLYAVDNGGATFWIMDVAKDGSLSFAKGFENGKRVRFKKDANNPNAAGPDTEGITVDSEGFVYFASERDNSFKGINYNAILKVNPNEEGTNLISLQEWDITDSLPQVSANMGIEAVEWVSGRDLANKLYDNNLQNLFDISNYPNAVADGVFFVALEDNGHVYAYILNEDGTSVQIADIDSKLGGAMALDYDTYEKILFVATDNGYDNRMAKMTFTGDVIPEIVHMIPATEVDITCNNEGFAIADASYTVNGQKPVYRFNDGVKMGALTVGSISSSYRVTNDKPTTSPDISRPNDLKVQNIILSSEKEMLEVGQTVCLTATVAPSNAMNTSVSWNSDNEKVAKVSTDGTVTAVSEGIANITVRSNDGSDVIATAEITVNEKIVKVTKVKLSKTSLILKPKESATLKATITPSKVTNKSLVWSSSNKKVATVKDGKIIAKSVGTATITVKAKDGSDKKVTCKITVADIKLSKTKVILKKGKSLSLKATVSGMSKEVTWKSSNPQIAAVSKTGKVIAKKLGTAIITAKANGVTTILKVTVK